MLSRTVCLITCLLALGVAACPSAQLKDTQPPADEASPVTLDVASEPTAPPTPPGAAQAEQACGPAAMCGDDEFCRFPAGAACGEGDVTGVCKARPRGCRRDCPGVCGCDGARYCNTCEAQARGVAVRHDGACKDTDAAVQCGGVGALPCPDGQRCDLGPPETISPDKMGVCRP